MVKLNDLNAFEPDEFTRTLGAIFEHSPWVAARAEQKRPFADRNDLHAALCETVMKASEEEKLALIRAHPDLVGTAALTAASEHEQASAGLGQLSPVETEQFC